MPAFIKVDDLDWSLCIWQRHTGAVADRKNPLEVCTGFEWDDENTEKNGEWHRVTPEEAAGVFFHESLVVRSDTGHSKREKRYFALGQTDAGRCLFVGFTVRGALLRVISVREMNRRERSAYAEHEEEADA
jgi:uncharacterized DUF497 family protein